MTPANRLYTKTAFKKVPPLYATEDVPTEEKVAHVKIFGNFTHHRHYIIEYNPETGIAFVLTTNQDVCELGYVDLNELQDMNTNFRKHRLPCPAWQRELYGMPSGGYNIGKVMSKHAVGETV